MPPTTSSKSERSIFALAPLAVLTVLLIGFGATGCAQVNNPWKDSSALVEQEMTTPSAEGFKGHAEFGGATRRDIAPAQVCYENGAVTHWPLWWEDPFEDKGNGYAPVADRDAPDTEFAWNWVDYLHIAYGPGRMFFVNTAGYPISAIVTPPGSLMESDGRIDKNILGYDHDAKRSTCPTREPPDVNFITKAKAPTEEAPANPPPEQPSKQ